MIPLGLYGAARPVASGGATLADAILALSPAGYWKLDETSGTTATDSSGNGKHGTYSGSYTLAGRNGFATFAGGHVNIPDDNAWSVPTAPGLTVFGLFYVNAITGTRQIWVSKGAAANYEWQIENESSATSGRTLATWYGTLSGALAQNEAYAAQSMATWHAFAFELGTPSIHNGRFPLYRDSGTALATTQPYPNSGNAMTSGTAPVRIAGRGDGAGPMHGAAAHVAIFPTELSAAQIGTLMDAAANEGLI